MELSQVTKDFIKEYGKKYLSNADFLGLYKALRENDWKFRNSDAVMAELYMLYAERDINIFDYMSYVPSRFMFDSTPREPLTELNITGTVSKIDTQAFAINDNLIKVVIGDNVEEIGKEAFEGCPKLKQVSLGNSVKVIKDGAFADTRVGRIDLPESVTIIGSHAFPEDCYLVSGHRKKHSLRFPKSELEWYRQHLVLDPALRKSAQQRAEGEEI